MKPMVKEALQGLLYTLLRDHIQPGVLERLVAETEVCPPPYHFSNEHLAAYANELVSRIADVRRRHDVNADYKWVVQQTVSCELLCWFDEEQEARSQCQRMLSKGEECMVVFRPLTPEEENMP